MNTSHINSLAKLAIEVLQQYIAQLGFKPLMHFELEGCCQFPLGQSLTVEKLAVINRHLSRANIEGQVVREYWQHQWEYVSSFQGQTPLKEATNLEQIITLLPKLFQEHGATATLIKPVVWSGDHGKLAQGSKNIFTALQRVVHIPNAIQMNISALDNDGENIIAKAGFGEYLQQCFLKTSLAYCLLYLPEPEAYERLQLKSKYGLDDELCSPTDISGGHQGSIALYKQHGKHNQLMGMETVLFDQHQQVLVAQHNWQKTARIEHRLGASSLLYNPYLNVVFGLANLADALEIYLLGDCEQQLEHIAAHSLPAQIAGDSTGFDALTLFSNNHWLSERISRCQRKLTDKATHLPDNLGEQLKQSVIAQYSQTSLISVAP